MRQEKKDIPGGGDDRHKHPQRQGNPSEVWRVWDADSVGGDRGRTRLIWGCGVRHEGVFVSHEKIRT